MEVQWKTTIQDTFFFLCHLIHSVTHLLPLCPGFVSFYFNAAMMTRVQISCSCFRLRRRGGVSAVLFERKISINNVPHLLLCHLTDSVLPVLSSIAAAVGATTSTITTTEHQWTRNGQGHTYFTLLVTIIHPPERQVIAGVFMLTTPSDRPCAKSLFGMVMIIQQHRLEMFNCNLPALRIQATQFRSLIQLFICAINTCCWLRQQVLESSS